MGLMKKLSWMKGVMINFSIVFALVFTIAGVPYFLGKWVG